MEIKGKFWEKVDGWCLGKGFIDFRVGERIFCCF
jgi:hypothetical protein